MQRREFLSRSALAGLLGGATCCSTGCGTLFRSERVGQPHSRDLDWKIVGLDALGLVFFFVPGVVAFVVDFCTGAIYLPHEQYESYEIYPDAQPHVAPQAGGPTLPAPAIQEDVPVPAHPGGEPLTRLPPVSGRQSVSALRRLTIPRSDLDRPMIERVVGRQIGRPLVLTRYTARVSPLQGLDQFAQQRRRHAVDRGFGFSPKRFFERLGSV